MVTETTMMLEWKRSQAKVDSYRLVSVSADGHRTEEVVPGSSESHTLVELSPGMFYTTSVTAERGSRTSAPTTISAPTGQHRHSSNGLSPTECLWGSSRNRESLLLYLFQIFQFVIIIQEVAPFSISTIVAPLLSHHGDSFHILTVCSGNAADGHANCQKKPEERSLSKDTSKTKQSARTHDSCVTKYTHSNLNFHLHSETNIGCLIRYIFNKVGYFADCMLLHFPTWCLFFPQGFFLQGWLLLVEPH